MSFLDCIDRFSHAAQHTGQIFSETAKRRPTPFADALLRTPLGDLARDVDPSELGLFTLVPDPSSAPAVHSKDDSLVIGGATQKSNVARVEFPGATPLRKPAGASKHTRRENDKEPEVYAEAALKYLDRYQLIRSMPRARQEVEGIIARLNDLRSDMVQLSGLPEAELKEEPSMADKLKNEERRIQELTMRIKQLKARKEVLMKERSVDKKAPKKTEEDDFWTSPPAPRIRSARKSLLISNLARGAVGPEDSLILDSRINVDDGAMLEDITMGSLAAPTPAPAPPSRLVASTPDQMEPPSFVDQTEATMQYVEVTPTPASAATPQAFRRPTSLKFSSAQPTSGPESEADEGADVEMDDDENEEAEETVILAPSDPPSSRKRTPGPSSPSAATEKKRVRTQTPPPSEPVVFMKDTKEVKETPFKAPMTPKKVPATPATPGTVRKNRVRITLDVERVIAKIWATVGETIMPGHTFNTADAATTNKPPAAKETIALLENLASQKPTFTASPSHSQSTLSLLSVIPTAPNTHIVLTAHLLLALLKTQPKFTMPLAAAKAILADANDAIAQNAYTAEELALGMGSDKALETRALYGCIARRLVKIDRKKGEEMTARIDI